MSKYKMSKYSGAVATRILLASMAVIPAGESLRANGID
jgi:hypothetical protein